MVGTFDDTAAVAAAIVAEEYAKQIADDLALANGTRETRVSAPTRTGVQAFAAHLLHGFDWSRCFEQQEQHPNRAAALRTTQDAVLVAAIYDELAAIGQLGGKFVASRSHRVRAQIVSWIRETVEHHSSALQAERERAASEKARREDTKTPTRCVRSAKQPLSDARAPDPPAPHVRLGVRQHDVAGLPVYHVAVESRLPDEQIARVAVNDLETQEQALAKIETIKNTLAREHTRLWRETRVVASAVVKQQLLSAEIECPTGREVAQLSKRERLALEMQDPEKRKRVEETRARKAAWKRAKVARMLAENPELAQARARRAQELAANRAAKEQLKAERARAKPERKTRTKVAPAERRTMPLWKTVRQTQQKQPQQQDQQQDQQQHDQQDQAADAAPSVRDPVVDALFEQLRQQVRETVGSPPPPGPPSPPPPPRRPRGRPRKTRDVETATLAT